MRPTLEDYGRERDEREARAKLPPRPIALLMTGFLLVWFLVVGIGWAAALLLGFAGLAGW